MLFDGLGDSVESGLTMSEWACQWQGLGSEMSGLAAVEEKEATPALTLSLRIAAQTRRPLATRSSSRSNFDVICSLAG